MIAERRVLAKKLRQARKESQIKQEQVARILGVPVSAISGMESGKRKVEAPELYVLASMYQKPMEWFLSLHPELDGPHPKGPATGAAVRDEPTLLQEALLAECLRRLAMQPEALRETVLKRWILQLAEHADCSPAR